MGRKAVCIGFLLAILLQTPVFATSVRIGYIIDAPSYYSPLPLENHLSAISAYFPLSTPLLTSFQQRNAFESQLEEMKIRHQQIVQNEGFSNDLPLPFKEHVPDELQWVPLQVSKTLLNAMSSSSIITEHLLLSQSLDAFVLFSIAEVDSLYRYSVTFYQNGREKRLYDQLVLPTQLSDRYQEALLHLCLELFATPVGMVVISSNVSYANFKTQDALALDDATFLAAKTPVYMQTSAAGYAVDQSFIDVQMKEVQQISLTLEKEKSKPLLITSFQLSSLIELTDGTSLPLPATVLDEQRFGGMTVVNAKGEPHALLAPLEIERIKVPNLTYRYANQVLVEQARDSFYSSFGKTVLCTAAVILVNSLSNSFAPTAKDAILWQPLKVGAAGALGVVTLDAVHRLFAYYQKTKYSFAY